MAWVVNRAVNNTDEYEYKSTIYQSLDIISNNFFSLLIGVLIVAIFSNHFYQPLPLLGVSLPLARLKLSAFRLYFLFEVFYDDFLFKFRIII